MKKYEVPYNFDKNLIDGLIKYKDNIDFIYVPSFYEDGMNTRKDLIIKNQVPKNYEDYLSHIDYILCNDFDVCILIQKNCTIELVDKYYALGIRIFTIDDDELAKEIKSKYHDIRLVLSITRVISLEEINSTDLSMYDEIVLYFNFCRQLQELEKLSEDYKYTLIVNSHCIYKCEKSTLHWNLDAENEQDYIDKVSSIVCGYCQNVVRDDKTFIPPEDLSYFDNYIYNYKLVDRLDDTREIIYNVDRYTKNYTLHKFDENRYRLE